jgi:hypothetical protein
MAERRMFAKTIIDSDSFLDMALSTQALYFHLSMRADDDGFINSPKKISKMIGASDDELKILMAKKFIIGFESGIVVIKHWKIHNYIQKDRYKPTNYTEEKALLGQKDNYVYTLDTECIQDVHLGKDRIGKARLELGKDSQELGKTINKKVSLPEQIAIKLQDAKEVINKQAFDEWIQYKKYKSIAPITKTINFLSNYDFATQQKIVDTSIMNNYKGLFEPKVSKGASNLNANISTANDWLNDQDTQPDVLQIGR